MPFSLSFTNPWALLLFPLLAAFFIWTAQRSLADLSPARRNLSTGLRLFILALVVLALAGTQLVRFNRDQATMFVLDFSDSVTPDAKERATRFVQAAVREKKPNDRAGIVVFGREAFIEIAPSTGKAVGKIQTVAPTEFTDIAAAIRLGMASLPDGMQKRLVVLSDGNENLGDALDEALAAASNEVKIDVVPLSAPQRREALLERMTLPGEAKIGEPVELRVVARAMQPTKGKIILLRDGEVIGSREVTMEAGKSVFNFPQTVEKAGASTFEARLEVQGGGDTNGENNRALGFLNVQGRPRVLMVSNAPELSDNLIKALSYEKVNVELRGPGGLPPDLRGMQPYDAIILDNVPAWELTARQMLSLQSYVRDLGCGLVMVGGENSYGPGGYRETPVEEALPVTMDIKQMQYIPGGAVALVMHSFEIPQGVDWAKSICSQVTRQLGDRDYAGLIVYGMDATHVYDGGIIQVGPNRNYMLTEIRKINPGDMPDFDAALEVAYEGLTKTKAALKHVIILSDGDPSPPRAALTAKLNAARITVSTVAIAPHDNSGYKAMFEIAKAHGGRYYQVKNPKEIPNIFLKEAATVSRSAIIEETFVPRVGTDSTILKGIGGLPPLLGYVGTTSKDTAREVLTSKQDDPILATWQYGLGKSVAWTSDARKRWAAGWLPWSGYSKFWAQAVRWSMRASSAADLQTNVQIDKGRGRVTIEAVDEKGNFLNFLRPKARLVTPDFKGRDVQLEQTGPGRYEATFDARRLGTYLLNIQTQKDDQTRSQITGGVVPYSPEYAAIGTDEFLLNALAERTNGERLDIDKPESVFGRIREFARRPVEIWLPLLILAACLFPIDVAMRRLVWGEEQLEKLGQRRAQASRAEAKKSRPTRTKAPRTSASAPTSAPKATTGDAPPSAVTVAPPPEEDEADLDPMERLRRAKKRARGE